jgi:hypothetical protein
LVLAYSKLVIAKEVFEGSFQGGELRTGDQGLDGHGQWRSGMAWRDRGWMHSFTVQFLDPAPKYPESI